MLCDKFLGEKDLTVLRNKVLADCQRRLRTLNMTKEDWDANMAIIDQVMDLVDKAIAENKRLTALKYIDNLFDSVERLVDC